MADHIEPLIEWRVVPRTEEPGLTPRGKRMPQTMEEWRYLADLYAKEIIASREKLGQLRAAINILEQKLAKCRRNK